MRTVLFSGSMWLMAGLLAVRAEPVIQPVNNRDYLEAVLTLINEATTTIDFLQLEYHYDPTVARIQRALGEAVGRGVSVRGMLEDSIDFNARSLPYLQQLGIDVKLDDPEKMLHSKLIVADRKRVLLGSTNLTGNSIDNNNETNVLIDDPVIAGLFGAYVEALLADSITEPILPSTESGSIKTVINRAYFSSVMELIQSAQTRIRVIMYGIKYYPRQPDSKTNQLLEALVAAHARGVDVEVIMDLSDYNETLNKVNREAKTFLIRGGVPVLDDALHTTTHAKMLLADDTVVIGSTNWGYDALERRNETCVQIADASIAERYADYFDRLKNEGSSAQESQPLP